MSDAAPATVSSAPAERVAPDVRTRPRRATASLNDSCGPSTPLRASVGSSKGVASGAPPDGFPVVLTADRSLFSRYDVLLDGMIAAAQTTRTPSPLMKGVLARRASSAGVRARAAPLGLRRIEAAFAAHGRPRQETAVVAPEHLARAVGSATRLVGLSSGDPLGLGMTSTTMASVVGGEPWTTRCFRRLARRVGRIRRRAPAARLIMGGPGAWQLAQDEEARRTLGIDHVILGYCEGNLGQLVQGILEDPSAPPVLHGRCAEPEAIPPILGPTVMGSVEISRGCGLGCDFCTLGREPMVHLPLETILSDVETNLSAGVTDAVLITEDVFRFGARGREAEAGPLLALLARLRSLPRLRHVQTDHANILSAAQLADKELIEIHRLLTGGDAPETLAWLNLGVETASGELLEAHGGRAKMGDIAREEWGQVCLHQVRRLSRLGYFPLVSLVLGLPGETQADVAATLRWVSQLRHDRVAVFPVLHAPTGPGEPAFGREDMTPLHWRLFRACYRLNFRWMPRLFWSNHVRADVPLGRRLLIQALGRGQVWWWRGILAWRSRRPFR